MPVSVLWIIGITNAMNLLDGIDGLVTGVTACIALSLALIHIVAGNVIVALMTLALAGACLGFLPFNFSPARIFLGDSGSLFIGVTLAAISMFSVFKETTLTVLIVPLVLFGLPIYDTSSVMVGRFRRGHSIFEGDKTHTHHRLLSIGLSHRQVALFLYCVTILLSATAFVLTLQQVSQGLITLVAGVVVALTFCWLHWRTHHSGKRL
jgi:UDP-GlcNAc:undecaprenyl-phosphate GlcNAc-1-phosphate transferase